MNNCIHFEEHLTSKITKYQKNLYDVYENLEKNRNLRTQYNSSIQRLVLPFHNLDQKVQQKILEFTKKAENIFISQDQDNEVKTLMQEWSCLQDTLQTVDANLLHAPQKIFTYVLKHSQRYSQLEPEFQTLLEREKHITQKLHAAQKNLRLSVDNKEEHPLVENLKKLSIESEEDSNSDVSDEDFDEKFDTVYNNMNLLLNNDH